jgi:hypothetical protein
LEDESRKYPIMSSSPNMPITNLELLERIRVAEERQCKPGVKPPLLYDPIEDEEMTSELVRAARERADAEVDSSIAMGRCHCVWATMKEFLQQEDAINWYSPAEMNPGVIFD